MVSSVFLPRRLIDIAQVNCRLPWVARWADAVVAAAQPWMRMSEDTLWSLVFGPTLQRSWSVWASGWCPACRQSVPHYNWMVDPLSRPWKMICPHCGEAFPKNDFLEYYRSGLNQAGLFDPALADTTLLFNAEHPDRADPMHDYAVDDGRGARIGNHTWHFIGAYLIHGQWKGTVLEGLLRLAEAYAVCGDPRYARRAAILLDRVADVYPLFDFATQAVFGEDPNSGSPGYISIWHDACEETRQMALAYDLIADAIDDDTDLTAFLARQAHLHGLDNPKRSADAIRRNIEERIFLDALAHRPKIMSNYPRTEIAVLMINAVLGWPACREATLVELSNLVASATRIDGVTGEKGLSDYAAHVIQSLALLLQSFERMEPGFLKRLLAAHPVLARTWRFFIDTWGLMAYYPSCGDAGWFAARFDQYRGVRFQRPDWNGGYTHRDRPLDPSMYSFMLALHEATGDPAYVQALYRANGGTIENLPWDPFCASPETAQATVAKVIGREGPRIRAVSVDFPDWHLALLRSGQEHHERVVWLDYDTGGHHAHFDGMNVGLFAHGLDLFPDLGYPPGQFGGPWSAFARWYTHTAAHNTVVVDGRDQVGQRFSGRRQGFGGRLTLWRPNPPVQCLRASGANLYENTRQYERVLVLVDMDDTAFYLVDIFRVVGGNDHAKFVHSHFGAVAPAGLRLAAGSPFGHDTDETLRGHQTDPAPAPAWHADWRIEDRYGLRAGLPEVHLRYTDLTLGAAVTLCEGWVVAGDHTTKSEAWIPWLIVRRQTDRPPLASTFVSLYEPYIGAPRLAGVRRLIPTTPDGRAYPESNVVLEIARTDGGRDIVAFMDIENPLGLEPAFATVRQARQRELGLAWDEDVLIKQMER